MFKIQIRIQIQQLSQHGSNTDPDPKNWFLRPLSSHTGAGGRCDAAAAVGVDSGTDPAAAAAGGAGDSLRQLPRRGARQLSLLLPQPRRSWAQVPPTSL